MTSQRWQHRNTDRNIDTYTHILIAMLASWKLTIERVQVRVLNLWRRNHELREKYLIINFKRKSNLAAPGAVAYHLQRCSACNATQPVTLHHPLNTKWATGSGNRSTFTLLDPQINLCFISFDLIFPSMRTSKIQNGCQGGPKWPTGSGAMNKIPA